MQRAVRYNLVFVIPGMEHDGVFAAAGAGLESLECSQWEKDLRDWDFPVGESKASPGDQRA